ncbi:MAG: hypothetical protein KDA91_11075 [Planctomycetaceae bacterium]|nr:hypothetical protein [Planctomycetaceae bacterium]
MKTNPRIPLELVCELHYVAFRAAFLITLDSLIAEYLRPGELRPDDMNQDDIYDSLHQQDDSILWVNHSATTDNYGFLDVIPLLRGTALQVQLQQLLETWKLMQQPDRPDILPLKNRIVILAATEQMATITQSSENSLLKRVWAGPRALNLPCDIWLHSKIRCIQSMNLELAGHPGHLHFPSCATSKLSESLANLCGEDHEAEELLEIVGGWTLDRAALADLDGLLSQEEFELLTAFFEEQPGLLS